MRIWRLGTEISTTTYTELSDPLSCTVKQWRCVVLFRPPYNNYTLPGWMCIMKVVWQNQFVRYYLCISLSVPTFQIQLCGVQKLFTAMYVSFLTGIICDFFSYASPYVRKLYSFRICLYRISSFPSFRLLHFSSRISQYYFFVPYNLKYKKHTLIFTDIGLR